LDGPQTEAPMGAGFAHPLFSRGNHGSPSLQLTSLI
jgi:hypothetical protein